MPRIRRPSLTHGVAAVTSVLSDVSTTDYHAANNNNPANDGNRPSSNPDLIVSAKKIFKVLRALDPRADNAHRGRERVVRLNKFRSYVNGKYSPDGTTKPPFRREDVLILFLGTKLDDPKTGDAPSTYIPGLLRACGTPSSNHSRANGSAELLKKSALPAMDLLRYLVCDLHVTEANANSSVFGTVFCSLPPEELRQLRLPLHLAGFGGKREGSREDASRILTHYLLTNAGGSRSFSCADVLDELLGPSGSEARLGYGGWLLTQPAELRRAANEAGIVDVLPNKRQVGSVTLVKTHSDTPLTFSKTILERIDDDEDEGDKEPTGAGSRNNMAGTGNSRRLSDQAFGVSARNVASATYGRPADADSEVMPVSIEEFASLKSELAVSRATVESLQTTVSRLSDTVADLLDRAEKKDVQTSNNMNFLRQENAKMKDQLEDMLLSQNEMKSKMGLLRISKESVHGTGGGGSDSWTNRGSSRKSFISNHDSDNSKEYGGNEGAGIGMSIRNVFNSMRNEQVSEDTLGTDGRSVDSLLWDD